MASDRQEIRDHTVVGGDQINAQESQGFVNQPSGPVHQTFDNRQTTVNILLEQRARAALPSPKPLPTPRYFIGRLDELARLATECARTSALVISGFPGIGKTTVLATFLQQQRTASTPGAPRIHWYELPPTLADTDLPLHFQRFVETYATRHSLAYDPLANLTESDKLNWLLSELERQPALLGLDNADALLDDAEQPRGTGWQGLFAAAQAGLPAASTLLLTSAVVPAAAAAFPLPALPTDDALALLRHELGPQAEQIEPKLLQQAVDADHAAGNPVAIKQLAHYVRRGTQLADALAAGFWLPDSTAVIEQLIGANWSKFSAGERSLLLYLSIFPAPVTAEVLREVVAHIPDAPHWTKAEVQRLAVSLVDQSVVEQGEGGYRVYPLVRAPLTQSLPDVSQAHTAAAEYYQARYQHTPENPPQVLPDVQPLLDAHYHLCQARNYGAALELLLGSVELRTHADTDPLQNQTQELLVADAPTRGMAWAPSESATTTEQITLTARLKSWGQYALVAQLWGRLSEGLEKFPMTIRENARRVVGENLLDAYRYLGADYHRLGQWDKAIMTKGIALEASQRIGDMSAEAEMLLRLANTYQASGDNTSALAYFLRSHAKRVAIAESTSPTERALQALKRSVDDAEWHKLLDQVTPVLAADGIRVAAADFADEGQSP